MANIKDVAKKAGVSITTVSRVINKIEPVNSETRLTVERAMEKLQYVPNQLARGMRTKRTHTIGIIIPEFINSFYHELFQCIEEQADSMGYTVLVCSTREKVNQDIKQIKTLISRRIDGIFLCTYGADKEMLAYLEKVGEDIPVIFLDNLGNGYRVDTVYTDGFTAMEDMVFHLNHLGHTNIGFIKGLGQYPVANDRFAGFKSGLEKKGLVLNNRNIFEGDYSLQSGYRAGEHFMERGKDRPTAIIASSDLMAIGAMNCLMSKGVRIPQDMALAGYDDISLAGLVAPSLTTTAQPIREIAKQAVGIMVNKSVNGIKDMKNVVLKGKLKVRHSTDPNKPYILPLTKTR
ncbi:MAG TPA: LacI family DNA-binding transcriptional regulator [Clostridia bacterium]|nr:LacI family DNA-binding transcriptional regulator [Clostridia bacterium]